MMARPGRPARPHFHLFGIPVTLDAWMLIGAILLFSAAGGGRAGAFAAVAITVFTLIHELGHSLVARRLGATDVSIRLAFLGGWTFHSGNLKRWQRNTVSLSGPLVQLVIGLAVLAI